MAGSAARPAVSREFALPPASAAVNMPGTMRISLLLIVAIFGVMLVGCGSINDKHRTPARINRQDPMMGSRYLQTRSGTGH